jgi:hypothetical protein
MVDSELNEFCNAAADMLIRLAPPEMSRIYNCSMDGDSVCFDFGSGKYTVIVEMDADHSPDAPFFVDEVQVFGENKAEADEIFEGLQDDEYYDDPEELVNAILDRADEVLSEFPAEDEE